MTRHAHREMTDTLLARARERAASWYPELDPATTVVRVERQLGRRTASIVILRLADASTSRTVVAKLVGPGFGEGPGSGEPARPMVMPPVDRSEIARNWYRGLTLSHRHFEALADPRLGSVRPLDLFDDLCAVVMEYVPYPTLRQRIRARLGRRADSPDVQGLVELAGLWLREYQAGGRDVELPPRLPTRDDFMRAVSSFCAYVADATGEVAYFGGIERMVEAVAAAELPSRLPLALAHGDYAPRNVFVGPGERVTGFDAAPRVHGPAHEDLARFVVSLRTGALAGIGVRPSAASATGDLLERRFLRGYYGSQGPPFRAIRAFEMLVLLNRLSAMVSRAGSPSLRVRLRAGLRSRIYYRRFRREVDRLAQLFDDAAP